MRLEIIRSIAIGRTVRNDAGGPSLWYEFISRVSNSANEEEKEWKEKKQEKEEKEEEGGRGGYTSNDIVNVTRVHGYNLTSTLPYRYHIRVAQPRSRARPFFTRGFSYRRNWSRVCLLSPSSFALP